MSYNGMGSSVYKRDDVLSATPLRLVCLTLNGAVVRIDRANHLASIGNGNGYRSELNRARALVAELLGALDKEQGGEIAISLESIYEFILVSLLVPGVKADASKLAVAADLLRTIKDGFDTILAQGAERATVG